MVVLFDVENAMDLKSEMGVSSYEILLCNLHDRVNCCCRIFDFHYLIKGFDKLTLVLCQNRSNVNHVLQSVHKTACAIVEGCQNTDLSINAGI